MPDRATWLDYRDSIGDRSGMFRAVADAFSIERALYLGSYVDLAPSTAIRDVTYVDIDARAKRFFDDSGLVHSQLRLAAQTATPDDPVIRFLAADYTKPVDVPDASIDLLISLFTAPAWQSCRRYLRPGGWLLANASHGEASIAALDHDLRLVAAVEHASGRYRLVREHLDRYLVAKKPADATVEHIRRTGRGIAYTRPAFAYVFQEQSPGR